MGVLDSFSGRPQKPESSETIPEFKSETLESGVKTGRLYDPYAGLSGALRNKRGALRLPEEPEYLFIEQAKQKRRSWSENLCYYTGMGYGLGALSGGSYGLMQLAANKPEIAIDSNRVRLNRFLNMTGRTGRSFGNAFGVLGLFFAAFESSLTYAVEPYVPPNLGTIGAGEKQRDFSFLEFLVCRICNWGVVSIDERTQSSCDCRRCWSCGCIDAIAGTSIYFWTLIYVN